MNYHLRFITLDAITLPHRAQDASFMVEYILAAVFAAAGLGLKSHAIAMDKMPSGPCS